VLVVLEFRGEASPVLPDAMWRGFFAASPDPCFAYAVGTPPAPRFSIAAVNPAWLQVTGMPADVVGRSLEELTPPEVAELLAKRLERAVEARVHLVYEEELRFKNQVRYWRTTIAPLVIDGAVRYLVCFGHDLTDMRSNAELERRLQQTQKLESLGVMAGGIAHDFNNLLTAILGHMSLVRMDPSCSPALQEHAASVETAAHRAAELCRQMLAYAGKGRLTVGRLDLDQLVRETTQLLTFSTSKNTRLQLALNAPGATIEGDASQLQQVIMNLVLNASEACDGKQGLVTITTGLEAVKPGAEPPAPHLGLDMIEGQFAFLEVADNGAGMTPQTQARMFDPFFTTKFTGRGLGLSAVLGIVRAHSGGVGVESEVGRGTKFRVLLPVAKDKPDAPRPPAVAPPLAGGGTVLIVDDEEVVRTVAARIVESFGYAVVTAEDGLAGVEAVRRTAIRFTAVLMDLTMPRLDGVGAFEQLRQIDPKLPVILMSGYDEQAAVARFAGTGLAGFLQKPFTAEMLRAALGGVVGRPG
jgi:PAS domain S-box-containing protein